MFGKQRKATNTSNESNVSSRAVKNANMTSGSRSTKSCSNKATQRGNAEKATSSKACGGKCKTTKSCS